MPAGSIASYAQAADALPPQQREAQTGIRERLEEEQKTRRVESTPGEGRGTKIDIKT